jgi:integrase
MAKVSLVITPNRPNRYGECVVMLQISALQNTIRVPTDVTVVKEFWNKKSGLIEGGKLGDKLAASKNVRLTHIKNDCDFKIINNADLIKSMDVNRLRKFLLSEEEEVCTDFFVFTKSRIEEMKITQKGSVTPLETTLKNVNDFWGKSKLDFNEINVRFLELFEAHYLEKGRKRNSVAFYLRYIRTMFNDAIDELNVNPAKPVILNYPFRKFKIVGEATKNRNLPIESIRKIRDFIPATKRQEITRDVFLLQFYLFGINIKDLFYLKPADIVSGRLQFDRFKTDRPYNIFIEPEASRLIEKYKGEKYLLWFADNCLEERKEVRKLRTRNSEYQYKDQRAFNKMINTNLKAIHDNLELNLSVSFSSYFVRHSFSTIMRTDLGISKDDISLCLGHVSPEQSMKVTGIYINEDFARADKANRKLIDYLNKDTKVADKPAKTSKKKKTSPAVV